MVKNKWEVISAFIVASISLYGSLVLKWPILEVIFLYWVHTLFKAIYSVIMILVMAIKFKLPKLRWVSFLFALWAGYLIFFNGIIMTYAELLKASYGISLADSIQDLGFIYGVLDAIEQYHLMIPVLLLLLTFNWFNPKLSNIFEAHPNGKINDIPNWVAEPFTTGVCRALIACVGYVLSIVFPEIKLQLILLVIILTDLSIDIFFRDYFKKNKM